MKICLATRNAHKIEEITHQLPKIEWVSLDEIECEEELPETSTTIAENSAQKALFIWNNYHENCLSDDSGLEVEALDGEPGVDSAHYSGERDSEKNIDLLLNNLFIFENKKARFVTILTLVIDGKTHQFEGEIKGKIINERKGKNGFGYDSVFVPDNYTTTFAEMTLEQKNALSHRSNALKKLQIFLQNNYF
ncbi:MAG: RdgB/HAM1 family non-canonical purine NTP pyrophosphatase [Bacteroidetes bacterium]|nr:MAG: RdgB/HAM1 family non-canonical purine NTP pyrophosphatase [Bacteroidota bacterium]TAG90897.1 MAG: RdgB/HAM1 family non-canonical purine NTP pyrophosphatase [Bacteroidota bacterium]